MEKLTSLPAANSGAVEAHRLRDLSPQQWKSGVAAWLGWLFDGLDMHLYVLVAAPFVMQLVHASSTSDLMVKEKSSWIQASFLIGWAFGGMFFGRLSDRLGRSRALSLTILTYALFTGLSACSQTWWQLMICRFLSALGIGGEWAVGASLISETWPKPWRPWLSAVLQTAVNIGVLLACLTAFLMADINPRYIFLVGVLPGLLVWWIRRHVPETEEWHAAKAGAPSATPGVAALFAGPLRRTTVLVLLVCACSLTAWWAFMFWSLQHFRNLPDLAGRTGPERERLVSVAFFLIIGISIGGNFFGAALARWFSFRKAIALMFLGFFLTMFGTFVVPRPSGELLWWLPSVGFFSGVFGLFTMYLPPLFPTLLRSTGAGFCFNVGRVAAAAGTVVFGLFANVGDFGAALFYASFLFIPAMIGSLFLPDLPEERAGRT